MANYNESLLGDLSDNPSIPTIITLSPGSNIIDGQISRASTSPIQPDSFTFNVPEGFFVSDILLTVYQATNLSQPSNNTYLALTEGSSFSTTMSDADYLISKLINSNATNRDLLDPTVGSIPSLTAVPSGLLGPDQLDAGDYSMWLRDSGANVTYQLNIVLESNSIPASNPGYFNFALYTQALQLGNGITAPFTPVEINGIQLALLFDETYYLNNNSDVRSAVQAGTLTSGFQHFVLSGLYEGRNPSILFDEEFYLETYQDVATAVQQGNLRSGLQHYLFFGVLEERDPSSVFDESDYLLNHRDVLDAVDQGALSSGFEHYLESGAAEGRNPSLLLFQESFYRTTYADVNQAVAAGLFKSGFEHYVLFGQGERRNPSSLFDESAYLANNPDVAAAVPIALSSGFEHYLLFGRAEGREAVAIA